MGFRNKEIVIDHHDRSYFNSFLTQYYVLNSLQTVFNVIYIILCLINSMYNLFMSPCLPLIPSYNQDKGNEPFHDEQHNSMWLEI